jgi:hypothetical protein
VTSLGIKRLLVYGDSAVVINQVNKDWDCTKDNIDAYYAEVRKLEKIFHGLEILHVLRDSNVAVDVLSKLGSNRAKVPPGVFVEELVSPSIKQPSEITSEPPAPITQIMVVTRSKTQDFIDYIRENKLPSIKEEATRIIIRSKNYVLVGDSLYRRAASSGVLLKCVSREKEKNPRRNPLRLLRQPCSLKDTGGQNFSYRVLLANSLERCRRTSQTVQKMPNVHKASSHTST